MYAKACALPAYTAHWIGTVGIAHISSGGVVVSFPRSRHIDTIICYLLRFLLPRALGKLIGLRKASILLIVGGSQTGTLLSHCLIEVRVSMLCEAFVFSSRLSQVKGEPDQFEHRILTDFELPFYGRVAVLVEQAPRYHTGFPAA